MSQDGCGAYTVTGIIANNSNTADDFPNEYRPYFGTLSNLQFTVPTGYDFVAGSGQIEVIGTPGGVFSIVPTVSGNGQIFDFTGTWPIPDKNIAGTQVEFTFQIAPNCASASGDIDFDMTINDEFLYAQPFEPACTNDNSYNLTGSLTHSNPNILLTPLAPIQNATDKTIAWQMQVCNLGNGDYEQVWMSFDNISNEIQYAYLYTTLQTASIQEEQKN